jgi:hypothetical protein
MTNPLPAPDKISPTKCQVARSTQASRIELNSAQEVNSDAQHGALDNQAISISYCTFSHSQPFSATLSLALAQRSVVANQHQVSHS